MKRPQGGSSTLSIERRRLANGLEVVLQPDARLPLVALELRLDGGSRREETHLPGLAHLVEHLAFEGPEIRADRVSAGFPALLQRMGGRSTAATAHDHVSFRDLLPAQELPLGLWVAAERLSLQLLEGLAGGLERHRRVLLQERRQTVEGRPYGGALEGLYSLLFPANHPYNRPPAGRSEGIRKVTSDDVEAFVTRSYGSEGAVLAITGDLDPARDWPRIEQALGAVSARGRQSNGAASTATEHGVSATVTDAVPYLRTYCIRAAPGFGRAGWHATALLAAGLASGPRSPLWRHLVVERGLARHVEGRLISMRDASVLVVSATAAAGVAAGRLEVGLADALDQTLAQGLPAETLERCRRQVLSDHFSGLQHMTKRAALCARLCADLAAPERLTSFADEYRAISAEALLREGRMLSSAAGRATLTVIPKSGGSG